MKTKKTIFYSIYEMVNDRDKERNINDFDNLQEVADYLEIKKDYLKQCITRKVIIKDKFIVYKFKED